MPHQILQKRFARAILACFEQGFELDEAAERFIASTLGSLAVRLLDEILDDPDHPERDALLMMLFTPSRSIQRQLEPLLERTAFDRRDEAAIIETVSMRTTGTHFVFNNNRDRWHVVPPEEAVDHFIGQLNVTKQLPEGLRHCINTHLDTASATNVKVMLRNSRFEVAAPRSTFLISFLERFTAADTDFNAALAFMIDFFEATPENRSILKELQERREFYSQAIRQARKHQTRLAKGNFETLMLQGVRPVYCDIPQSQDFIILIDRICETVYGQRAQTGGDARVLRFVKR
jgi:hypothetical protein